MPTKTMPAYLVTGSIAEIRTRAIKGINFLLFLMCEINRIQASIERGMNNVSDIAPVNIFNECSKMAYRETVMIAIAGFLEIELIRK
jgi:hypothetical protein